MRLTCQLHTYKGRCQWIHSVSGTQDIHTLLLQESKICWNLHSFSQGCMPHMNITHFLTYMHQWEKNMTLGLEQIGIQILTYLLRVAFVQSFNQHETLFPYLNYMTRTINTFLVVVRFRDNVYKITYVEPDLYGHLLIIIYKYV